MCLLCVTARLSRRIVIMLTWLVIPLITLWAFSQLLPPSLRFEITSTRLVCIFVLLISIGWYEIIFPQLSAWRAHRSALMKERERAEAQMAAKWRKEAIRKCRNCSTAYRDQNPGSGRFMCGYCGHISRRPVLDITKLDPGTGGSENMGNYWSSSMGTFREILHGGKCPSGESCSELAVFIVKSLEFPMFLLRCLWKMIWRWNTLSERRALNSGSKANIQTSEDRCDFHAKKVEKAKRKAEEKRQARLVKEMLEEEERKQREEVARLVEERRKLRKDNSEVEKESEREIAPERELEIHREKETGTRRRIKEKVKVKVSANDNLLADAEAEKNKKGNNDEKSKLEKNGTTGKKIPETAAQLASEPMKNLKNSRVLRLTLQKGFKTNGQSMKGVMNGTAQVGTSRCSAPMKYYIVSCGSPASYSSSVTWVCGEKSGLKPGKKDNFIAASSNENGSAGSASLDCGQSTNSVWNRTACSNIWNKGTGVMHNDTCNKKSFLGDIKVCGDSMAVKHANGCMDRLNTSELSVGVELQTVSQMTNNPKSWENLCARPSTYSCMSHSSDLESKLKEEMPVEITSNSFAMQAALLSSPYTSISLGSSERTPPASAAATTKYGDLVSDSRSAAQLNPCDFISPNLHVSPVRLVTAGNNSYKDSFYEQDAISLLGPVSESLGNYSAVIGSSLPLDTRATGVLSSGCTRVSAPSHRPVHIPSPVSRASSTETNGSLHVNGDQISRITDLWSLPSLFSDVSNESHETQNWHLWDTPKVGQSTFGKSSWLLPSQNMSNQERNSIQPFSPKISESLAEFESPIPACIFSSPQNANPNQENGDANFCLSQPVLQPTVEGCNGLDGQLIPPNFVNCIKEGAIINSLNAAEGNTLTM